MSEALSQVDEESRARFDAEGVVCLRGVLPSSSIKALSQAVDALSSAGAREGTSLSGTGDAHAIELAEARGESAPSHKEAHAKGSGANAAVLRRGAPPEATVSSSAVWRRNIIVRVIALDSALPQIAASILGAVKVNLCGDRILIQEPRAVAVSKFARDEELLPIADGRGCAIGICLDPVEKQDAMAFVAGSHGWSDKPASRGMRARTMEAEETIRFATLPGDVVIHHLRTLNAVGDNSSARERRTLWLFYCAEDMRFRRRPGVLSRVFYRELKDGGSLDSPDFPVVWPRPYPAFAIATLYDNPSFSEQPRKERK